MTTTEHPTVGKGTSAIEWTEETWNPVTGCSHVSAGCDHCYAETLSLRHGWSKKPWTPENAKENVVLHPERLNKPFTWRKPRVVFVNSMSDLFHEEIPLDFLAAIWDVMVKTPQHTYQVLTKRPQRIPAALGPNGIDFYAVEGPVPCSQPNIWLGTSIESWRFNYRADQLRRAAAAVRFISAEPLLDTLYPLIETHRWLDLTDIHWLIVGGESGHGYRPMRDEWVRELRREAQSFGVAFFFKQWGGRTPKAGGRELDGRTWDEMPSAASNLIQLVNRNRRRNDEATRP